MKQDPSRMIRFLTGKVQKTPYPAAISEPDGGGKFSHDGDALVFPGNTFICHLDKQSRAFEAVSEMQTEIMASPFARYFTFLPPSSFHMTIFQGITSLSTSHEEGWPGDIPFGTSRDGVSGLFLERLEGQSFTDSFRASAQQVFGCFSIAMAGASSDDEAALRSVRDKLSQITSIRFADHDDYAFHITLAYPLMWVNEETAKAIATLSDDLFERYKADLTCVQLGAVEFCNFETMHHFETLTYLRS